MTSQQPRSLVGFIGRRTHPVTKWSRTSCCADPAFEQDTRTPCICVPSVRVTVLREPDVRKDAACRPVPGFRRRAEHSEHVLR